MTVLLAHQGGWDELLWFSIPILAVLAWVRWAERRARLHREAPEPVATLPDHEADD